MGRKHKNRKRHRKEVSRGFWSRGGLVLPAGTRAGDPMLYEEPSPRSRFIGTCLCSHLRRAKCAEKGRCDDMYPLHVDNVRKMADVSYETWRDLPEPDRRMVARTVVGPAQEAYAKCRPVKVTISEMEEADEFMKQTEELVEQAEAGDADASVLCDTGVPQAEGV